MMLHTVIPMDMIDPVPLKEPQELWIQGVQCSVIEDQWGNRMISRIFSTDLRDYLKPELAPGFLLQAASAYD